MLKNVKALEHDLNYTKSEILRDEINEMRRKHYIPALPSEQQEMEAEMQILLNNRAIKRPRKEKE